MDNISFSAQNMIDQAFSQQQGQSQLPQSTLPNPNSVENQSFSQEYFGQADPNTLLEDLGPVNGDETRRKYRFAGDGKIYNAKADKPLDKVLENIWEYNSPGLWGAAKAQTLYGLPAELSSAISYGLGGLGLDESSDEWRDYSDNLKKEYERKYGQFMVPGFKAALDKGHLWDYAMQNIGYGAPYMGLALAGGGVGAAIAGEGLAGVGSFLGSTAITSPVLVAQFADRQVAEMRAAGVEDPENRIDWLKAAGLGTLAAGAQALPVESILFGGPILSAVQKWGVKTGTPASSRILAAMADIAGTNALVGAGTGFLSRLNADMPLLDDHAKQEYLEGVIVGSLVGLPFGLYKGIRTPKHTGDIVDKPLDQIISENEVPGETPSSETGAETPGDLLRLGPPKNTVFHNPNETYGIQNAEDAAEYLNSINYIKDGKEHNGLEDFVRVHGISYDDPTIVDSARRVKRLNSLNDYIKKTPDGVLYPDIDSIPQIHSNDPKILSKAKYLTDYFGYDDAHIKSLSDSTIEKLYRAKVKAELEKNPMHKDVYEQVLKKADDLIDEQALKDVEEYGSLYKRPDVLKRVGQTVLERKKRIEQNPREKFAKMLFKEQRPSERDGQKESNEVEQLGDWAKKSDQEKFDDAFVLDQPRPQGPRALLEYKPAKEAEAIDKAANSSDPRDKKETFYNFIRSPLGRELLKKFVDPTKPNEPFSNLVRAIKDAEKFMNKPIKHPKPKAPGKPVEPVLLDKDVQSHLQQIRDHLRKVAEERSAKVLKENPELGPALNDIFKRFSEMQTKTGILNNPTTRVFKARKFGIIDALANRAKILHAFENAFQYIDKNIGTKIGTIFDKMLQGAEVDPKEVADIVTTLDMAFHFDTPELKNVNTNAIEAVYRKLREGLSDKARKLLEDDRATLENWYKATYGIHTAKDLPAFKTVDLEANAFSDYLRDTFSPNYKNFQKSKLNKVFKQFETVLKRLKKELGDQGYTKVSDLLEFNGAQGSVESVPLESRRPDVLHRRLVQEVQDQEAPKRLEELSKSVVENNERRMSETPKDAYTKAPKEYKGTPLTGEVADMANNVGSGWAWTSWARSIPSLAREIPIFSRVYNNLLRQHTIGAELQTRFANKFSTVFDEQKGWQPMYDAHKILDHMRLTDQTIKKDSVGRLVYTDESGILRTLSHQMTKAVEGVTDIYKEPYRAKDEILRGLLAENYKDEGLSADSSLNHIKRVLQGLETKIKGNPFPQESHMYRLKYEALEQLHQKLQEVNDVVQNDNPYVPYMRFGDYVVDVIDRKTGKQVFMTSINDVNKFGNTKALPGKKQIEEKIKQLGLRDKFNANDYQIRPYQLTYNNIGQYLNKGLVSTDLIQSLMSSGLNEHLKVADHLATDIPDPGKFFKDIQEDVRSNQYRILRYVTAKGAGRFSMKADKIPGYSQDWGRVLDTYLNIHANSLAKQAKLQEWGQIQADLIKSEMPQHLRDKVNRYIDYQNDPGSDFAGLRWFNFTWAMGFGPSSAVLQLVTLPQQTAALGFQYFASPKNFFHLNKAMARNMPHAISNGHIALPKHVQAVIDKSPGYFRTGVMEDTIKGSVPMDAVSRRLPQGSNQQKIAMDVAKRIRDLPGVFIKPAEKFTRTSTYDFFHTLFNEHPEALTNALKQREKDWNWQGFWDNHKDIYSVDEAMAVYSMLETHAVYGKEARGNLQRGLTGSLLFPFTNYAQQVMEVLGSQLSMKRGLPGLRAGLWTMGTYIGLAGLAGIPAYDLWKTLYEQYQSSVNNRTVDAEMEMQEAGMPDWLRHGLLSASTGLDMSSRIGQEVIAQKLLEGALKGEYKFEDVTGLPGKTAKGLFNVGAGLMNPANDKSPMELIAPVLPKAAQDVFKAYELSENPENVLKTATGKILRDPDSVTTGDIMARATGFSTLEDKEARQRIFWQQRANQEFTQAKSRFSEGVATARYKMVLGARRGDSELVNEGRQQLNQFHKEIINFAKDNKINLDVNFWYGFNNSVKDRLWQKLNPGKIYKPTKGELRHIESLINNE